MRWSSFSPASVPHRKRRSPCRWVLTRGGGGRGKPGSLPVTDRVQSGTFCLRLPHQGKKGEEKGGKTERTANGLPPDTTVPQGRGRGRKKKTASSRLVQGAVSRESKEKRSGPRVLKPTSLLPKCPPPSERKGKKGEPDDQPPGTEAPGGGDGAGTLQGGEGGSMVAAPIGFLSCLSDLFFLYFWGEEGKKKKKKKRRKEMGWSDGLLFVSRFCAPPLRLIQQEAGGGGGGEREKGGER